MCTHTASPHWPSSQTRETVSNNARNYTSPVPLASWGVHYWPLCLEPIPCFIADVVTYQDHRPRYYSRMCCPLSYVRSNKLLSVPGVKMVCAGQLTLFACRAWSLPAWMLHFTASCVLVYSTAGVHVAAISRCIIFQIVAVLYGLCGFWFEDGGRSVVVSPNTFILPHATNHPVQVDIGHRRKNNSWGPYAACAAYAT